MQVTHVITLLNTIYVCTGQTLYFNVGNYFFPLYINYVSMTIHTTTSCIMSHNTQLFMLTYLIRTLICIDWGLKDPYLSTVKKCSPIFFAVTDNMTCVDTVEPFSFGSQCNFTCREGYYLNGDSTLTCLASGQWSKPTPTCTGESQKWCSFHGSQREVRHRLYTALMNISVSSFPVVQCNSLKAPPSASVQCQHPLGPYSYGSVCIVQCEEGFDLIGTNVTKCSSQGNWSHALPVCQGKTEDEWAMKYTVNKYSTICSHCSSVSSL